VLARECTHLIVTCARRLMYTPKQYGASQRRGGRVTIKEYWPGEVHARSTLHFLAILALSPSGCTLISAFSLHRHLDRAHVVCLQMKSTPIHNRHPHPTPHPIADVGQPAHIKGFDTFMSPLHDPTLHPSGHYSHSSGTQMLSSRISNKATAGRPSTQPLTTTIGAVRLADML
jgi:hypothetical protein